MIKLSIIIDEKQLTSISSEEILREIDSIYSEFRKELAVTSVSTNGSIFIGLATESDSQLIKSLLNLPAELRSGLIHYIENYVNNRKEETEEDSSITEVENIMQNEKIKNLLFAFPHKDIEILIDRPSETGRDIQL